jgi:heme exporter protein CcmB
MLRLVGLEGQTDTLVRSLSRGMKQRLALARATIHEPLVLLLDEPDTGLDQHWVGVLRDLVAERTAQGGTTLLTTHNLERSLDLADSVAVLNSGRIVFSARRDDLDVGSFKEAYSRHTGAGLKAGSRPSSAGDGGGRQDLCAELHQRGGQRHLRLRLSWCWWSSQLRLRSAARRQRHAGRAGISLVSITLGAMMGLSHVFSKEREQGSIEGLLLCPVDRSAIYVGKFAAALLLTAAVEAAILPLFALFTDLPVFLPPLLLTVVLGTIGFVAVGTLFSAMAVHTRTRELMLPLLLLPVAIPIIVAAIEGTRVGLEGKPWGDMLPWITILSAFDSVFLVLCPWLFQYVMEEMGS